jgi:mannose-6-phosphate isomerase
MPQAFHLDGVVQRYDWGGTRFIPELLGQAPDRQTSAELWLGVHPKGMAHLRETGVPLDEFLAAQHYTLPFLLKVLDVRASLSIQVHPDRDQAVAGFARENANGISLDSPVRNYKDPNHKPEVMVAITPCVLLYGFSAVEAIVARCAPFASLQPLQAALETRALEAVYRQVMQAPSDALDRLLAPLLREVLPRWRAGELSGEDHLFWLARAASEHGAEDCRDPGLLALLMMNLVHVAPGAAVFQPARLPHAYLHGCNVELMANSDNVLRGGLTSKHVDVEELLAVVDVHSAEPAPVPLESVAPGLTRYRLPTDEFSLMRVQRAIAIPRNQLPRISIILNMGDECRLQIDGTAYALTRGESLLVAANADVSILGTAVDLFIAA